MHKIQEAEIKDKRVLLRLDLNVPIEDGQILGDKRIREAIPTIEYLLKNGASQIIIITHLGKPKGHEDDLCLWPIANRLIGLLKSSNKYYDCPTNNIYQVSDKISILENLRFNPGEEENDPEFAKQLASKADIFINDAFGTCHRAHATTVGVTKFLPSYAGLLIQKEIENLEKLLNDKGKPFTVILGGSKIADKLPVIKNLMSRADNFLIGGAIANTFLAARRHHMGESLIEPDSFSEANIIWKNIMDEANRSIFLPTDVLLSKSDKTPSEAKNVGVKDLLQPTYQDYSAVDIGSKTVEQFSTVILQSRTIFWNGNMGISEVPEFAEGTKKIAEMIGKSSGYVVIGGGDTVAAFEALNPPAGGSSPNIFLSTGGGATLEFLAGKQLPGLKALGYQNN